tara:strand:- start:1337 stop:1645 length:309 start_codon:yes stop_codon:yes gene_type:complete
MYKDDLVYEFNDDMWYLWHDGTIDDDNDFYNQKHEWIDNKVIYTYECKKICDELDYDIFEEHHVYGKAETWSQAAFAALYDLLSEHDDALTYDEMIKQHEEA